MDITQNKGITLLSTQNNKYILFGAVFLRVYMNLVSLGVFVSLPVIVRKFDAIKLYPLISVSYTAILAVTALLGGRIGSLIGRKKTIMIALLGIMIGAFFCALAPSLPFFLMGYVAFGFAYGLSLPLPIVLLCDISTISKRSKYMSIYTAANNFGMLIGPFLGGFVTDNFGFAYTPLYPIPLAILAMFLLGKFYPKHNEIITSKSNTFDYIGVLFLALGIVPLVIGLNLAGGVLPWLSWEIISMILGGLIFCIVFIKHEKKIKYPLIEIKLFKVYSFTLANIMLVLIVAYFSITNNYVNLFVQEGLGFSATISGTLALPKTLVVLVLTVFFGKRIAAKIKSQKIIMILSGLLILFAELIIVLTANGTGALTFIYISMAFFGAGELMYFMTLQPYMQSEISDKDIHAAMSIQSFSTVMGLCIMSTIFGIILNINEGSILSSFSTMGLMTLICSVIYITIGIIFAKN